MSSRSAHPSYDWQRLASPAPSSASGSGSGPGSHHGAQRLEGDPFHGSYPNAPRRMPIALPETGSPMIGFTSPGSSLSSRSRHVSLPPEGTGLGIYGLTSPPTSPESIQSNGHMAAPIVHPLLRGGANSLSALLVYNVLVAPTTHGTYALRNANGARVTSHDLSLPATHPPCSALRVSLLLYPGGASRAPRRFPWDITLTPSRRASAPPTAPGHVAFGDALASLHLSLLVPVFETELRQFSPNEVQNAQALFAARRQAYPNSPVNIVRADFLCGCTEFAGFVRNADYSFVVRMAQPSFP